MTTEKPRTGEAYVCGLRSGTGRGHDELPARRDGPEHEVPGLGDRSEHGLPDPLDPRIQDLLVGGNEMGSSTGDGESDSKLLGSPAHCGVVRNRVQRATDEIGFDAPHGGVGLWEERSPS